MNQRRLYLTDQDAQQIDAVLTIRTGQRDRAYVAIASLSAAVIVLLAILGAAIL
ncbi:MAG: hypothetical protein COB08_005610 [Rhodobacteraceae bacterium]|nr:hypothetical protein [Paracoccaceae bacterium]